MRGLLRFTAKPPMRFDVRTVAFDLSGSSMMRSHRPAIRPTPMMPGALPRN